MHAVENTEEFIGKMRRPAKRPRRYLFPRTTLRRPMVESPSSITYEQVVAEFDEIIKALRSREVPREPEDIPEFKM